MPRTVVAAALLAVALAAAACGGDPSTDASAPEPTPSPTAGRTPATYDLAERCTGQGASGEVVSLPADDGSELSAAVFGDGERAAVFVHQTGMTGLCGWVPYAEWAAGQGIRAVVVEVCGYGRSICMQELADDPAAQLALAVDWVRAQGARSVTVVGASMGGSLAVGAGERAGADALVDLSGPADWQDVPSIEEAVPAVTIPLLLMFARADSPEDWRRVRSAAEGTDAVFVDVPGAGHGYTIVTDGSLVNAKITSQGRRVLAWINGGYREAR